jgi:hypothetical protein
MQLGGAGIRGAQARQSGRFRSNARWAFRGALDGLFDGGRGFTCASAERVTTMLRLPGAPGSMNLGTRLRRFPFGERLYSDPAEDAERLAEQVHWPCKRERVPGATRARGGRIDAVRVTVPRAGKNYRPSAGLHLGR